MRRLVGHVFGFGLCLLPNGALPSVVRLGCKACLPATGDALVVWVVEGGTQHCWQCTRCGFVEASFFVVVPAVEAPVSFIGWWLHGGVALRQRAITALQFLACSSCCSTAFRRCLSSLWFF